jgi:hypothetical protein
MTGIRKSISEKYEYEKKSGRSRHSVIGVVIVKISEFGSDDNEDPG